MFRKGMSAGVLCVLVLVLFAGCPGTTPTPVVGAWKVSFDSPCTGGVSNVAGMFLYSNGTVEVLEIQTPLSGTWTLGGNILVLAVSDQAGASMTLQATLSGNTLTNGTYNVAGSTGCWTATKPQF